MEFCDVLVWEFDVVLVMSVVVVNGWVVVLFMCVVVKIVCDVIGIDIGDVIDLCIFMNLFNN